MTSPRTVRTRKDLMSATDTIATARAVAMTPYMWKAWNRNISWIRNQDTTSPLVATMPKYSPDGKIDAEAHAGQGPRPRWARRGDGGPLGGLSACHHEALTAAAGG